MIQAITCLRGGKPEFKRVSQKIKGLKLPETSKGGFASYLITGTKVTKSQLPDESLRVG